MTLSLGLLIVGSLETLSGGYLYDRKLVEHLEREGERVEIVCLPWRNYARHLGDNFSTDLLRRLSGLQVEALLQDELNHPSLFWLNQRLKRQVDYPLVSIVHHLRCSEQRPAWQNWLYRKVERLYLASVDAFIFNSQTTRQATAQMDINLNARPSVVAYPAGDRLSPQIEEQAILSRTLEPGPLRLVFLGNVIARKGLHTLLEALERLPPGLCRLAVAGSLEMDQDYAQSIRRQVAEQRLGGRVRLCGALPEDELAALLASSHLLVVPSSYEGFGIVYLEGMGFGLPAIATTCGAAHEIITHKQDGYLLPSGNANALAAILAALAHNRQRLGEMGLAARRRYLAHPTWEQSARRIRDFLAALVGTR
ncbi:MAG: glycosyltransferase family 4 protein [Anaerolineales bacterium]|nr:glycosyltransferase family 4 protein [Anaerolineales bacterium]